MFAVSWITILMVIVLTCQKMFSSSKQGRLILLLIVINVCIQEADLPTLSDILYSGGYGNMTIPCECQNEATCRQQINIISDVMVTVTNNGTSFVSPSYRHQLYCSCNSGFTGNFSCKHACIQNLCFM